MSLREEKREEYWYFRVTERFIFSNEMLAMRRCPVIGYKFGYMFMELCALAIHNKGWIRVPKYTSQGSYLITLAEDMRENPKDVEEAMSYYIQGGLVKVYTSEESTAIYVSDVDKNMGRAGRRNRELPDPNKYLLPEEPAYEGYDSETRTFGMYENISMSEEEYHRVRNLAGDKRTEQLMNRFSAYKKAKGGFPNRSDFEALLEYLGISGERL